MPDPGRVSRLLQLNPADGQFEPVDWPASSGRLAHVETKRMEEEARQAPGPGTGTSPPELRFFAWTLEESIPALVRPIYNVAAPLRRRGAGPPGAMGPRLRQAEADPPRRVILGFAIVELNRAALDRLLGELAQRYFAGPDGFIYDVAVVSDTPEAKVIYRSDPQITAVSLNPPDARAALVPATAGENRVAGGVAPPRDFSVTRRGTGRGGGNRGSFMPRTRAASVSPRARGALILPSAAGQPWQLLARHKGGSLESVVAADRRRNLLLSFGVLLLLAVSMALIIISTQRARRLARLQMEFVAGVSHRTVRTPVAVICSAAWITSPRVL